MILTSKGIALWMIYGVLSYLEKHFFANHYDGELYICKLGNEHFFKKSYMFLKIKKVKMPQFVQPATVFSGNYLLSHKLVVKA